MRRNKVEPMLNRLRYWRPHEFLYAIADGIEAQELDEEFIFNPASNGEVREDGLTDGGTACCFIAHQLGVRASSFIKEKRMGFAEWDSRLLFLEVMIDEILQGDIYKAFLYGPHPMGIDINQYDGQLNNQSSKGDIRALGHRMRNDGC